MWKKVSSRDLEKGRSGALSAEMSRPIRSPAAQLTAAERVEFAKEHVLYEITHFIRSAQAIDAAKNSLFPMNFAIEVFALHTRNLIDFFFSQDGRKTDVRASLFFPSDDFRLAARERIAEVLPFTEASEHPPRADAMRT